MDAVTGAPRLVGALATFDCRLSRAETVDSHAVMFGAVEQVFIAEAGTPLIYANRNYAGLAPAAVNS